MLTKRAIFKAAAGLAVALAVFGAGVMVGANTYNKPKSILHLVAIKWTPESTPEQRTAAMEGVEKMAAEIPGIKNIWIKRIRVQPANYNEAFAIEFEDQAAADRYAKHPAHEAWYKVYIPIRGESRSFQVTN